MQKNPAAAASRVASLAPSATATLRAIGAADALVGVTHHCDVDAGSHSDVDAGEDAARDDVALDAATHGDPDSEPEIVGGWPNPDLDRVAALDPDAVLTCDPLQRDTAEALRERGLPVHHVEPTRLPAVFDAIEAVGAAVGRPDAAAAVAADCRRRVDRVREAVPEDPEERPVVYCEEWSDPPMAAGNWVPDAVEAAGGRSPFVDAGDRSREVDEQEVLDADPAYGVIHVCGRGAQSDPATFDERGWDVDAEVHVVDDTLLNQPSPRLVDGIEELARILHGVDPDGVDPNVDDYDG
ncbi:helical backbone metal receptor [Halobaculum sp. D14]|uniref:helical backbone metal receptor n=1 Tax=Halobaculum sp. D14 TaxID=3421642 RepID=UPI003EB827D3